MTPIYTETAAYAKSVGELDLYRVSLHENKNCKNAIDKAISENFDGFHLKKDCYKPVIEQFGQERMLYVLATHFNCAAGMGVSLATTRHGQNTSPFRAIRQRAASIVSCSSAKAIPPFWMDSSA